LPWPILAATDLNPDTVSVISDWVKVGAGGLTIGGLMWACVYVSRLIWQTFVQNMIADNKRLRAEMAAKDAQHRTELEAKDLLISKRDDLIDRLRREMRTMDDKSDQDHDDLRDLRSENAKLRDQWKGRDS
jgi:hypothetical protein